VLMYVQMKNSASTHGRILRHVGRDLPTPFEKTMSVSAEQISARSLRHSTSTSR
jgi:hypothetical protein